MTNEDSNTATNCLKQEQMLKLVTNGFYKELIKYGIPKRDIITISTYLLDHVIRGNDCKINSEFYNGLFTIRDIEDKWDIEKRLKLKDVSISPLMPEMYSQVAVWLKNHAIKYSFISLFPDSRNGLKEYLDRPNRYFFTIFFDNEPVGVIGADNMDNDSKKLEMKKFIGNTALHGKGIGKLATFLFHYYCFCILNFNKVYIHSGETNIHNINLNSKFGYELEGMFFDEVYIDNESHDVVRMGLLKSRWMEIFSEP